MVQEILTDIKKAESKAAERIAEAKRAAIGMVESAERQIGSMEKKVREESRKTEEDLLKKAALEAKKEIDGLQKGADGEVEKVKAAGGISLQRAVALVMKRILE